MNSGLIVNICVTEDQQYSSHFPAFAAHNCTSVPLIPASYLMADE